MVYHRRLGRLTFYLTVAALLACVVLGWLFIPSTPTNRQGGNKFRIVALAPAIAQTLRDLGIESEIVGRHGYDAWSDPAMPVCGDQAGIDYERLLAVNPSHVFLQWGKRELPERLTTLAKQNGWQVRNFSLLTLDEVIAAADELHGIVKPVSQSSSAPSAQPLPSQRFAAMLGTAKPKITGARVGRVLILHTTAPPAALGPGSYHHDLLISLGATPAIETGAPYMTLDAEDIARLKPDAIILIQPRTKGDAALPISAAAPASIDQATLTARLGLIAKLDIPAIKSGRVAIIDDEMALLPGTNLIEIGRRMGEILAQWSK